MAQAPLIRFEDFELLLAQAARMKRPTHYLLLVTLMRDLGLRPIELARLERSWFRGRELRIPAGKSKRGKPRTLPLSPAIRQALDDHMLDREGRLFRNRTGDAFSPALMSKSIARLFSEAGVDGSCYSARRTMASRLVDKDVNIVTIQHILGHSDASTTQRYVSVSTGMMERALFG